MMKKQYIDPEMRIKKIDFRDVIVTSGVDPIKPEQDDHFVDPGELND